MGLKHYFCQQQELQGVTPHYMGEDQLEILTSILKGRSW